MGQPEPPLDPAKAITDLREALAIIDDSEGRIPRRVTDPQEAAKYVRADDAAVAESMLGEARALEAAGEQRIRNLVKELDQLPPHSDERAKKREEAMDAFEDFLHAQETVTAMRDRRDVIVNAHTRQLEFAPRTK